MEPRTGKLQWSRCVQRHQRRRLQLCHLVDADGAGRHNGITSQHHLAGCAVGWSCLRCRRATGRTSSLWICANCPLLARLSCGAGIIAALTTVRAQAASPAAIISLGVVGVVVTLYFIIFSAPDLALTQLLIEVLTVVLLVLVLLGQARSSAAAASLAQALQRLRRNGDGIVGGFQHRDHQRRSTGGCFIYPYFSASRGRLAKVRYCQRHTGSLPRRPHAW